MTKKIAYMTNIAPHYRENLWLKFAKHFGDGFHFYFGYSPNQSIKSIDFKSDAWKPFRNQIHTVGNVKVKHRLVYQRKVIREVLFKKWDVIILLGDPNIISNWIIAVLARTKGIPVIFWGHGIYGKESGLKKLILKRFLSLADLILTYGHWAKQLLIKENFNESRIRVVYNSVDYSLSQSLREKSIVPDFYKPYFQNDDQTIIFIGRLTKVKKLHLLIQALRKLNDMGKRFNLMVIGDGVEKENLEKLSQASHLNTHFYGACYDEEKIAKFLANADLCVSPGNVGLTAMHAMSYGTPVCTNNDFKNQMPEFESIQAGETGCFFDQDKQDLPETILEWFEKAPNRQRTREKCYEVIDKYYNPKVQLDIFKEVLEDITK